MNDDRRMRRLYSLEAGGALCAGHKRFCWHKYEGTIRGAYRYSECEKCGQRKLKRVVFGGHVPGPDFEWLDEERGAA